MTDEDQRAAKARAAKAWLLKRYNEDGQTQDQIAEILSPFVHKGLVQTTVSRAFDRINEGGYPNGKVLRAITAFLGSGQGEADRSGQKEFAEQAVLEVEPPAAVQSALRVATENAQDGEPVIVEVPASTLEEIQAAQTAAFLARQAEVDRVIEAVYERLAAAGVVEAGHTELHGDARLFHAYAIRFEYLDRGAEIVGFGPPGYECTCGDTLSSHRSDVPWEQRLQDFSVAPGSDRPSMIGMRPTAWLSYEPCLDEKWFRGEALCKKLARWRRARKLTLKYWGKRKLPFWPSRHDIDLFEAVLQIETDVIGPQEMLSPLIPILDWRPFVYDHEAQTMSMDDALAHQHTMLKNSKMRAFAKEVAYKVGTMAGYVGLLILASLFAVGVWVQDLSWSGAVSSPVGVLVGLGMLMCLAWWPRSGTSAS